MGSRFYFSLRDEFYTILEKMKSLQKPKRKSDRKFLDEIKRNPCSICGALSTQMNPVDPAHIQSKGAGGGDDLWNIVPLCRVHHSEQHRIGMQSFVGKYVPFKNLLKSMGWKFENGKMIKPEERGES